MNWLWRSLGVSQQVPGIGCLAPPVMFGLQVVVMLGEVEGLGSMFLIR